MRAHSEAINITTEKKIGRSDVHSLLDKAEGEGPVIEVTVADSGAPSGSKPSESAQHQSPDGAAKTQR